MEYLAYCDATHVTSTDLWRNLVFAKLCAVAAIAAASLLQVSTAASSAQAQPRTAVVAATTSCAKWNISGKWLSVATNNYDVTLIVAQHGTRLTGSASIPAAEAVNSHYSTGKFSGTLIGRHFEIVVVWAARSTDGARLHGKYVGTVVSGHIAKGIGIDLTTKPTPTPAGWVGYGPTRCLKV